MADFNFTLVVLESATLEHPTFGKSDSWEAFCRCLIACKSMRIS